MNMKPKEFADKLARLHLKVSKQRKDFVVKTARTLCVSNDTIVLENLNIRGLVKNHNLAMSISLTARSPHALR